MIWSWLVANKTWLFSGAGVVLLSACIRFMVLTYLAIRRGLALLPSAMRTSKHVSAISVGSYPAAISLLSAHNQLLYNALLYPLKLRLFLEDNERERLYSTLRSDNTSEDFAEFWLIYVAWLVNAGESLAKIVAEHRTLPVAELRTRVATFVVNTLDRELPGTADYIEAFPPLQRAFDRQESERREQRVAALRDFESFLRTEDELARALNRRIDQAAEARRVTREDVVEVLSAFATAGAKDRQSWRESLQHCAAIPEDEFAEMIRICLGQFNG